ncbi:MAG: hypothetical protein ACRDKS_16120 [Actinomycetota bacterium]
MREEYVAPVGFAKEPSEERRRWIGRFFLALVVAGLAWILYFRVINPPEENPTLPTQQEVELPGPQ